MNITVGLTRTRVAAVALLAGLFAGVAATPVSAHEGHGSCAEYGAAVSGNAQSERPWGQIVSNGAQLGFTSALVEEAHTTEGLCEPRL
jgi:hypothetical protein